MLVNVYLHNFLRGEYYLDDEIQILKIISEMFKPYNKKRRNVYVIHPERWLNIETSDASHN